MACLLFSRANSYVNIGCAEDWRRILTNHTTSMWVKTTSQEPACILSLSNGKDCEIFSIDLNISSSPIADTCGIAANRENYEKLTSVEKGSPGARSISFAPSRSLKVQATQFTDDERRRIRGICSGGLRVKVRDMEGSQISVYSYMPILADDRWHFIQVSVAKDEVLLWVDGRKISVNYDKKDTLNGTFWTPEIVQRPIFPSQDLVGCRLGPTRGIADQFCGRISDISVEKGGPGGEMLHWWVMDNSNSGSVLWDRGPDASRAVNMSQSSCKWEYDDVPPTSLSVNGTERRFLTARALTTSALDKLLPRPLYPYGPGGIVNRLAAGSIGSTPAAADAEAEPSPIPILSSASAEHRGASGHRRVVLDLWIMSYTKDPAVLAVVPFSTPLVILLNADGSPSIALVDGTDAFVTQRDVCDGKWHRLSFAVDQDTGASFSVDGLLSTSQHFSLISMERSFSVTDNDFQSIGCSVAEAAPHIFEFDASIRDMGASMTSMSSSTVEPSQIIGRTRTNPDKTEKIRSLIKGIAASIAALAESPAVGAVDESSNSRGTSPLLSQSHQEPSPGDGSDGMVMPKTVVIGTDFCGFVRDVMLTVGRLRVTWALSQVVPDRNVEGAKSLVALPSLKAKSDASLTSIFGCDSEDDRLASAIPTDVSLTISGRSVIWAKCLWDSTTPLLDMDTHADLGEVLIPEAAESTGLEIAFYTRLLKDESCTKWYGHIFSVDRSVVLELQENKVIITIVTGALPSASQPSPAQNSVIARRLPSSAVGDGNAGKLAAFVCNTATFEDGEWHFLRITIMALNAAEAIRLVIDDSAVEVTPVGEAAADDGAASLTSAMSGQFEIPSQPLVSPRTLARLKSAGSGEMHLRTKRQILLDAKYATTISPENNQTLRRLRVTAGGTTPFRGTMCNIKLITDGKVYVWPLQDGTRHQVSRLPLLHDEAFRSHPNRLEESPFAVSTRPSLRSHYEGQTPTWSPMTLPPQSLRFDGESTFVSSISLGLEFNTTHFDRFAICVWMKEGVRASGKPEMGCICSIHDSVSPDLECAIAIYVHTRLENSGSRKTRRFAPNVTTFVVRDTTNRYLCLEINSDIYDRVWHKIHWVVHESSSNESHIFIDDLSVHATIICSESPVNFCANGAMVLNVGGCNNNAAGVKDFFCGELRNFVLCRDENDDALSWSMADGQGYMVYDTLNRVVGAVNCPTWEYTTFPPTTPAFHQTSAIEFSKVKDCEDLFRGAGCRFSLTVKSRATRVGSLFSIVSSTKKVLVGFNVNDGGDVPHTSPSTPGKNSREGEPQSEEGSHTLFFHRLVKKNVVINNLNESLRSSLDSPRRVVRTAFPADQVTGRPVVRKTNKEFLKELLRSREPRPEAVGSGSNAEQKIESEMMWVVELVKLQLHHKELCDGKWHELSVLICASDPNNCVVQLNGRLLPFLIHSVANVLTLPESDVEAFRGTAAPTALDNPNMSQMREDYSWHSFVLGKSQSSLNSFKGCVKNTSVTAANGTSHLSIPFASNVNLSSPIPRDVATSNITWELCVSPNSSIFLGDNRYIAIPPVPSLNMSAFRVTFQLRTPSNTSACLVEFGHASKAYFCIMLNQDTQGSILPNSFCFTLIDSKGNELTADCLPEIDICDNAWHEISITVNNSAMNLITFAVDGQVSQARYGGCGGPNDFTPLEEGGTIGTLLEVLSTRETLEGSMRYVRFESLDGHLHAKWDIVAGYGTAIMDSSSSGAPGLAVNPMWRSDIADTQKPMLIPRKAENVFRHVGVQLSVSRWSNNEADVVEKSNITGNTLMREFPFYGWNSGAIGPQWITIDLGAKHTIFSVEVELFRSTPSLHELYFSRTSMSGSKTGNMAAFAGTQPIPTRTLVTSWDVRSTSPKVMETQFERPFYNIRYLEIVGVQSATPIAYQNIRITAVRGDWVMTRKYSVMQALGRTPTEVHTPVNTSMFPDTFTVSLVEEDVFNPFKGNNCSFDDSGADRDMAERKTPAQQLRELKLLFFTEDVNRVGYIDIGDFIRLYREADTFGTASDDQIVMQLRDVGVTGNTIDFEKFIKIFSKFYSW